MSIFESRLGVVLGAILLACAPAAAAFAVSPYPPQPTGSSWPTLEWSYGPAQGVDMAAIGDIVDQKVRMHDPKIGETRAVVIVQGGQIVLEKYAAGYSKTTRLVSWSMAKSITQAAVGVAAAQGVAQAQGRGQLHGVDRQRGIAGHLSPGCQRLCLLCLLCLRRWCGCGGLGWRCPACGRSSRSEQSAR
jgi:hypothetical protein